MSASTSWSLHCYTATVRGYNTTSAKTPWIPLVSGIRNKRYSSGCSLTVGLVLLLKAFREYNKVKTYFCLGEYQIPPFGEKILTVLWWGEGKLNSRQKTALTLDLLVDQTRTDGLCAGNLTCANTNMHILKVTWHVPHLALRWLGAELRRGGKAAFSLTGPRVRLWAVG